MLFCVWRLSISSLAYLINEKSSASSTIAVRRSHAFGNVTIYWRALVSPPSLNDDVVENIQYSNTQIVTSFSSSKLAEELIETEGSVTCPASQLTCSIPVKVKDDEVEWSCDSLCDSDFYSVFFYWEFLTIF